MSAGVEATVGRLLLADVAVSDRAVVMCGACHKARVYCHITRHQRSRRTTKGTPLSASPLGRVD